MNVLRILTTVALLILLLACSNRVFGQRIRVSIVTDEADAVLKVLDALRDGKALSNEMLRPVFRSEGYVRLREREHSFGRKFEDDDFRKFLASKELASRREALRRTLNEWKLVDFEEIGRSVLKYLPESATIGAKVYPVIKPAKNSFVFDLEEDPAIFLYLDENVSRAKFENTVAHELHHIGFGTACPSADAESAKESMSAGEKSVLRWTGAFGEGFAMLAAAGGPDVHPHKASNAGEQDRDVASFDSDLLKVQDFFTDLLAGKLSEKEEIGTARSFYGIQGPWYTVGWKMAVVIEEELGRPALIDCFCDGRKLLRTFNRAAALHRKRTGENLAVWDTRVFVGSAKD